MSGARVAVLGCGAFVEGFGGLAGWSEGTRDDDFLKPKALLVPSRQRRRASLLSRAMADAYGDSVDRAGPNLEISQVASVFGSALGEAATMIELLDKMWDEAAMLSPMKFATSVHNAASGTISIATGNRGFTTSIGADYDTPAMALFEAMGWVLAHDEPVVVCCGDEAPPPDLVPDGAGWALLSAAIVLGPVATAPGDAPRLSALTLADADTDGDGDGDGGGSGADRAGHDLPVIVPHDVPDPIRRNPNVGLLDLVVACERGERGRLRLDRGEGRGYTTAIHDAESGASTSGSSRH